MSVFSTALKQPKPVRFGLYCASLVGTLMLAGASHYVGLLKHNVGTYTAIQYSVMAIFMVLAWYLTPKSSSLKNYTLLLITAVLVRVILINAPAYTSNDADRYLFDGKVAYEGFDPYRTAHNNSELIELRKQWHPPAEHAAYVTLYPPLALGLFTFSAAFGIEKAQLVWRFLLLLAGVLTVFISALVLKKAGKLHNLPLVALSPLLILEAGVGLHIDVFSALAVVTALYCWQQKQGGLCALVLGLGMCLKVLPVMLMLPLFFIQQSIKSAITLVLAWLITVLSIYGITLALGFLPVGSLGVFFEKWRNAAPIFSLLDNLLTRSHIVLVLLIMALIMVCIIARVSYKQRNMPPIRASIFYLCMQAAVALPLLLSPVLFPWYLLPLVPLIALKPNVYALAWMILMPLTYEVLNKFINCGIWQPATWPTVLLGILYSITLAKLLHVGVMHYLPQRKQLYVLNNNNEG
jgi:hypothetical protein